MKPLALVLAFLGCCAAMPASAGPSDVYVPAHRTADGHWVPANVPPSSGGTRMAKKLPSRSATKAPVAAAPATPPTLPPLLVDAEPIRR